MAGIWMSYRPASLCSLAGRYDNPMPLKSGTMNLPTGMPNNLLHSEYEFGFHNRRVACNRPFISFIENIARKFQEGSIKYPTVLWRYDFCRYI
jgi:hypothetical protein